MSQTWNIAEVINTAKLGRARREAQEDTCAPFAAALYDVLKERGVKAKLYVAKPSIVFNVWYHSVVKVGDTYYDSRGEFSEDIYRKNARVHPKVTLSITYKADVRTGMYEEDMEGMYEFYALMLRKSFKAIERKAEATQHVAP